MPRKPRSTASGRKPSKPSEASPTPPSTPAASPSDGLLFPDQAAFETWLEDHHATATSGTWILMAKKANTNPTTATLTYDQAVDAALCFGWIDGQRKSLPSDTDNNDNEREGISGATHFAQRFTPRRSASLWSRRNVEKITTFMTRTPNPIRAAGLAQVEAARADGRWDRAYAGPKDMVVPEDLEEAIRAKGGVAVAAFDALSRSRRYPLLQRIETARGDQTRKKRIAQIVDMLAEGKA